MSGVFVPVRRDLYVVDYAWVDDNDAERVSDYRWCLAGSYALSSGRRSRDIPVMPSIPMHRFILGLRPGDRIVHHINEDTLDNRRENLKVVANLYAHGDEPHPRRDRACGGHRLPPHERELVIAAGIGVATRWPLRQAA